MTAESPRVPSRPRNRGWLPRRMRPTREGWWFLGATLLLGMAAVNAGLNLLFAVFGMMLFLILASGVMSEQCLRKLHVRRRLPNVVHAGAPYLMGISVLNQKRRVPTFSLEVEDLTSERPVERRCYFLKIPAGREQETAYRNRIHSRGEHQLTGFRLSTRFPFGFIRKSRDVDHPVTLLVYPALVPVPASIASGALSERSARNQPIPDRSGDFSGLRDYRVGDDPRQIHWRSSAKRSTLLVRESEEDSGMRVVVHLVAPARNAETVRATADEHNQNIDVEFEQAVSMAASVTLWLLARGYQVGFVAGKSRFDASSAPYQANRILTALALVKRESCADPEPLNLPGATICTIEPGPERALITVKSRPKGRAA